MTHGDVSEDGGMDAAEFAKLMGAMPDPPENPLYQTGGGFMDNPGGFAWVSNAETFEATCNGCGEYVRIGCEGCGEIICRSCQGGDLCFPCRQSNPHEAETFNAPYSGAESFEAGECPCGCAMVGCVCSPTCGGACRAAESFAAEGQITPDVFSAEHWSQENDASYLGDRQDLYSVRLNGKVIRDLTLERVTALTELGAESFAAEGNVLSESSLILANMERELGINSEDYEDFTTYPNPIHRLSAAIAQIEQEFGVKEEDFHAESFEARTYRRTPKRQKSKPSKSKRAGKMRRHRKLMSARKAVTASAEEFGADYTTVQRPHHIARVKNEAINRDTSSFGPNNMHTQQNRLGRMYDEETRKWVKMDDKARSMFEDIGGKITNLDVVATTQRVIGKTGLKIPAGAASLAILWVAFMTGKQYGKPQRGVQVISVKPSLGFQDRQNSVMLK